MVSVACLTIGSRVVYDGEICTVVALAGDRVTVQEQRSRRALSVRIASLLSAPGGGLIDPAVTAPVGAVGPVLASLTDSELRAVCERAAHVREVLTGYRSGSREDSLRGKPRAEYRPGVPLMERYRAKAAELAVGVTSVRRWARGRGGVDRRSPPASKRAVAGDRFAVAGCAESGAR